MAPTGVSDERAIVSILRAGADATEQDGRASRPARSSARRRAVMYTAKKISDCRVRFLPGQPVLLALDACVWGAQQNCPGGDGYAWTGVISGQPARRQPDDSRISDRPEPPWILQGLISLCPPVGAVLAQYI